MYFIMHAGFPIPIVSLYIICCFLHRNRHTVNHSPAHKECYLYLTSQLVVVRYSPFRIDHPFPIRLVQNQLAGVGGRHRVLVATYSWLDIAYG